MRSHTENPERADAAQHMPTKSGHGYLVMLVVIFVAALTAMAACSPSDSTAVPETAVTAEIDQLLDDYIAPWNTYDADALRPLLTDGFMWYETDWDPKHSVSTGASKSKDFAETLLYVEGSAMFNKLRFEWVGEPIMTGVGPWLVSRAWRVTAENYYYPELQGISIYTIVDEDGALKVARAIAVSFEVE